MTWQPFKSIWLPGFIADPLRRCPHRWQRPIYGDEINALGGKRARCVDCGRLLPSLPPPERDARRLLANRWDAVNALLDDLIAPDQDGRRGRGQR